MTEQLLSILCFKGDTLKCQFILELNYAWLNVSTVKYVFKSLTVMHYNTF